MPDFPQTEAQVSPQIQPGAEMPTTNAEALGAGVGGAIGSMGEVGHRIYFDAKVRADQTASLAADNATNELSEKLLRDPKTGLLYQETGKDAPAATAQAMQAYDEHVAKTMDGLTNDQQKKSYQHIAQARRFDMQRQLDQYEHAQGEQYAKGVNDKAIAGTVTDAVNNSGDPEAVADALARQKALIADYGKGRMTQETVDLQTQQHSSATQMAVIEHMSATGNDLGAKAWYDEHKDELMGHDAIAAANMVKAGSRAGEAQRWTDEHVLDEHGNLDTRENIDAKVREIKDPLMRDEAQTRVDRRLAQHHQELEEQDRSKFMDLADHVEKSPQGINDPYVVTGMANLSPERRSQLQSMAHRESAPIPAYSKDYAELNDRVGTPEFPGLDLTAYRGKIPDSALVKFSDLQREQRERGLIGPKVADELTDKRIVDNALYDLHIDKDLANSDAANLFRSRYDTMKAAWMAGNGGKPLTEDNKLTIQKALIADHATTVARGWYNPARWVGDATTTEKTKLFTQDADTVRSNIPGLPIPGTAMKDGSTFSQGALQGWVENMSGPSSSQQDREKLERWSRGRDSEGRYDPALITRYQMIRDAVKAKKAGGAAP